MRCIRGIPMARTAPGVRLCVRIRVDGAGYELHSVSHIKNRASSPPAMTPRADIRNSPHAGKSRLRDATRPIVLSKPAQFTWHDACPRRRRNRYSKDPDMTPDIKRILVPLDFSTNSQCALDYAHALASKFDAALHLVH